MWENSVADINSGDRVQSDLRIHRFSPSALPGAPCRAREQKVALGASLHIDRPCDNQASDDKFEGLGFLRLPYDDEDHETDEFLSHALNQKTLERYSTQ